MNRARQRTRRAPSVVLAAVVLAGLAAGCGSGDGETTADPTTPVATTDTTEAATGEASVDTTPGATLPPGLPQTSMPPQGGGVDGGGEGEGTSTSVNSGGSELTGAELEAFLAERYRAYWDAFDAARAAPTANPTGDFPELAGLAAGEQLDVTYQSIIDLAQAGEAIREPDQPAVSGVTANDEHRIRIDRVDGTLAELSGCVVNDDVRFVTASGVVVREGASTVQAKATMAVSDGQWKLIRSEAVQIADGVTGCWESGDFPY